jgi:hypothetical protein
MRSSSSSSASHTFIDLTDVLDDQEITNMAKRHLADCSRELAALRARVYDLEYENSEVKLELRKTKLDLQFAQGELKVTREALGEVVVANRQVGDVLFHCLGSF